jgi:hypothetical protein
VANLEIASKAPPIDTGKAKRHASTQAEKMNEAGWYYVMYYRRLDTIE